MLPLMGISALGQPRMGSIYDETGTWQAGYAEGGPYNCGMCVHKTAKDEPFCIHPKVVGDSELQDRLVQIDGRPTIKIDMIRGCCSYVRGSEHGIEPKAKSDEDDDANR